MKLLIYFNTLYPRTPASKPDFNQFNYQLYNFKGNKMVPIHKQWPTILVKQALKWKLNKFGREEKYSTQMARFLVDILFDRKEILNYSLDDLINKKKERMTFHFSFVQAFYRLTSMSKVRSAISDKLSHLPGRTKAKKSRNNDADNASSVGDSANDSIEPDLTTDDYTSANECSSTND